ncbi:MAG: hypothetical protein RR280_04665 [Bacteroidaceae bacterium]
MKLQTKFYLLAFSIFSCTVNLNAEQLDTLELVHVERKMGQPIKRIHRVEYLLDAQELVGGSEVLRKNVSHWMGLQLARLTAVTVETGKQVSENVVANDYEKQYIRNSKKEILAWLKATKGKDERPLCYTLDVKMVREYETPKMITFKVEAYQYGANRKGLQSEVLATFRKSDGKQLTWNDVPLKKERTKLNLLVAKGVQKYYETSNFTMLKERLSIQRPYTQKDFPLPMSSPGFTKEGLKATYLIGEISEEQTPSVTLSYSQIRSILQPNLKALLK